MTKGRRSAEATDASRRAHKSRLAELAKEWDPRKDGWDNPPRPELVATWIDQLGEYKGVILERDEGVLGGPRGQRVTAYVESNRRS